MNEVAYRRALFYSADGVQRGFPAPKFTFKKFCFSCRMPSSFWFHSEFIVVRHPGTRHKLGVQEKADELEQDRRPGA
jgi:hypothetical protein